MLARRTELPAAAAGSFLRAFELGFGHRNPGGALLWGHSAIRSRPLVRVDEQRWLCSSPVNLLWALRPRLEAALKPTAAWESYQSRRAATLERRAEQQLIMALTPDAVHANVRYDIDAVGTGFEADRLLRLDDILFCVEVKAGDLSARAERGVPSAVQTELDSLIGHGAAQAVRLRRALREHHTVRFLDRASGAELPLDLDGVRRVEPMVITLRDLTWLYPHTNLLRAAGILPPGGELPWTATIYDLEVIAHIVEFPSQLTHFLARRRILPAGLQHQTDELNLFMLYTQSSLEGLPTNGPVMLPSTTEELDSYWMFGKGERPAMKLSEHARTQLDRLGRERKPGWVAAGEQLISHEQADRPAAVTDMRAAMAKMLNGS